MAKWAAPRSIIFLILFLNSLLCIPPPFLAAKTRFICSFGGLEQISIEAAPSSKWWNHPVEPQNRSHFM